MKVLGILALSVILSFPSANCYGQVSDSSLSNHIFQKAHEIRSCEIMSPFDDLKFLQQTLKGKRIVSMGEATHGTREFAQIKARFFRYLVENEGFNIIALEADFADALEVNAYVTGRSNDGLNALKRLKMFHCVNAETLELIEWMRLYNVGKEPEDQVKFYGFDFQGAEGQLRQLEKYFSKTDTNFVKELRTYKLVPSRGLYLPHLDIIEIQKIRSKLLKDSAVSVNLSSKSEWQIAMRLTQALDDLYFLVHPGLNDFTADRDLSMKQNIDWILNHEGPHSKILLWAHNNHVMYGLLEDAKTNKQTGAMGFLLKETYGRELYTIGLDFNKGRFYANKPVGSGNWMLSVFEVEDAPQNSVENILSKVPYAAFLIDITTSLEDPLIRDSFEKLLNQRNVGGLIEDCANELTCAFFRVQLAIAYDGLFFINQAHEVTLLK